MWKTEGTGIVIGTENIIEGIGGAITQEGIGLA